MPAALVIDDEEIALHVFDLSLRRRGFRVLAAQNGEEAIKTCRSNRSPLDLVICDVVLPRRSGPAVMQDILTIQPEVPVLLTSGTPIEGWRENDRSILSVLDSKFGLLIEALSNPNAGYFGRQTFGK